MEDPLVPRTRYLESLKPFIGNGNAKVITGMRRCGKSSLLSLFAASLGPEYNTVSVNTELRGFSDIGTWEGLLQYAEDHRREGSRNVLIVDEVQNIPGWELAVRDMIARNLYDIYLTGSNANLLSSEYATHLGGRYNSIPMLPLSYSECRLFAETYGIAGDLLGRYIRTGGLPLLWVSDLPEGQCRQTVRDIAEAVISKDVVQRFSVRNISLLKEIYRTVLSTIGCYVSSSNIHHTLRSRGSNTSADTVNEYIGYLEAAGLIARAEAYDIRGRRILGSKRKYYATDPGLKHAEFGYRPEDTPAHMENIIFNELRYRGYRVYVGDAAGREIDFVAERDGSRLYIQACTSVADSRVYAREFGNLERVGDSFPKYVVTFDDGPYSGVTDSGIICCGLGDFLLRELRSASP